MSWVDTTSWSCLKRFPDFCEMQPLLDIIFNDCYWPLIKTDHKK